jgi:glutamine synthetase
MVKLTLAFTADEVMQKLKNDQIKFIDLQFTDLTGRFHHTTMAANMFHNEDFTIGLPKLDGSSIRGFTEIHESDLIIKPDPSTYAVVPWIDKDPTARLICDVLSGGVKRDSFPRDPRGIARRASQYVCDEGYDSS